ncbi:hypothetical protein KIN20_023145 [Parelaphostrongylus tenuis]|uniref:Uncharacterized protein n=1 Tax=Parelaphostrongylus tenuis TaxID=148309 RepID=A0AAD5N9V1_PARTN|nr:hypothetical protein KIN20_023145 [Parelaphostrongylus tenuis]
MTAFLSAGGIYTLQNNDIKEDKRLMITKRYHSKSKKKLISIVRSLRQVQRNNQIEKP